MRMQRYIIKDEEGRILSDFRTNSAVAENAIPIEDDAAIPGDLYAGDEPRLRWDGRKAVEVYPSAPGEDYDWDGIEKQWIKRPDPVDRIAELESRVRQLEEARDVRSQPQ